MRKCCWVHMRARAQTRLAHKHGGACDRAFTRKRAKNARRRAHTPAPRLFAQSHTQAQAHSWAQAQEQTHKHVCVRACAGASVSSHAICTCTRSFSCTPTRSRNVHTKVKHSWLCKSCKLLQVGALTRIREHAQGAIQTSSCVHVYTCMHSSWWAHPCSCDLVFVHVFALRAFRCFLVLFCLL